VVRERDERNWYQWSVSPAMFVDNPYALVQLTGIASMAETFEELKLPETKLYRVRGVGATFVKPRKTVGGDGKPTVTYVADLAPGGAIVDLIAPEAERLEALGAVVPAEAPKGYDELGRPELEILATQRGVTVRSTGADPQNPLDEDYRNALALFDLGSDSALVGAASNPGGVVTMSDQGVSPVLVDGVHPSPATEQDAETHAVTESDFLPSSRRPDTLGGRCSMRAASRRRRCPSGSARSGRTRRRRSRRRTTIRTRRGCSWRRRTPRTRAMAGRRSSRG
jgi:hypothetical protein